MSEIWPGCRNPVQSSKSMNCCCPSSTMDVKTIIQRKQTEKLILIYLNMHFVYHAVWFIYTKIRKFDSRIPASSSWTCWCSTAPWPVGGAGPQAPLLCSRLLLVRAADRRFLNVVTGSAPHRTACCCRCPASWNKTQGVSPSAERAPTTVSPLSSPSRSLLSPLAFYRTSPLFI